MSSLDDSSDIVVNIYIFYSTHFAYGGMRNNYDQVVGVKFDVPDYEWVDPCVIDVASCFRGLTALDGFFPKVFILKLNSPSDAIVADCYSQSDRVCHGQENAPLKFIYVYITFFNDLPVTLPFNEFTIGVLQILNVAPTQLYLNSYAAL